MGNNYLELEKKITKEINIQLISENKTSYSFSCEECRGRGWTSHPMHVCGGNEKMCYQRCPEEEQVQCERCGGSGYYEIVITKSTPP